MKTYIAYFDHLGFKEFIERNDFAAQKNGMMNILRDIESAFTDGILKEASRGVIADLSKPSIQALNFSDTVLFYTQDDSEKSLLEILKVAYRYNWVATCYTFPARGALAFGEIEPLYYHHANVNGGKYTVSSIFGKGLVDVHEKAESTNWSGAVIDNSILEKIREYGHDPQQFLNDYAKWYPVPYKYKTQKGINEFKLLEEYAFKLVQEPINEEAFKNRTQGIVDNFASYNKRVDNPDVQKKIENTIEFLKSAKQ